MGKQFFLGQFPPLPRPFLRQLSLSMPPSTNRVDNIHIGMVLQQHFARDLVSVGRGMH